MSENLVPFLFEGEGLVRVVVRDGQPWFVGADVCKVLGIRNTAQALQNLDEDEKGLCSTYTLGGLQEVLTVSEGGLFTIALRCRDAMKPGTVPHRFRKWVTADVLPAIRKTGSYSTGETIEPPDPEKREFPEWPLDEWRVKLATAERYDRSFGKPASQWIMQKIGFPVPPKEMIEGRQLDLFTQNGSAANGAARHEGGVA